MVTELLLLCTTEIKGRLTRTVDIVVRNEYKVGNRVYMNVVATGISSSQNRHEPEVQYVTRKNEVALRGKKVEMYCIFGGT